MTARSSVRSDMQKYLPYAVLAGLALLALTAGGELLWALVITLAFAVGWLHAMGRLFGRSPGTRAAQGRTVLGRMSDAEIDQVLALMDEGENIGALARVRDVTGAGLNDAKDAVAVLARWGNRWNSDEDQDR